VGQDTSQLLSTGGYGNVQQAYGGYQPYGGYGSTGYGSVGGGGYGSVGGGYGSFGSGYGSVGGGYGSFGGGYQQPSYGGYSSQAPVPPGFPPGTNCFYC